MNIVEYSQVKYNMELYNREKIKYEFVMRNYLILTILGVFLFSCQQDQRMTALKPEEQNEQAWIKPKEPDEPACLCEDDWPSEELHCYRELVWDYPIKPGTEAWENIQTFQGFFDACQIPNEVLISLTTEDLTEICLQHPMIYHIFSFNTIDQGLDKLFNDFKGLRVLFEREHVSKELLKQYQCALYNLSFLDGTASAVEKGYFKEFISVLEALLTRCNFYDDSPENNVNDYKEILKNLLCGFEKKIQNPNFSSYDWQINIYARAKLILKISPQSIEKLPQEYRLAVFGYGWFDNETLEIINKLSYQLIK